MTKKITLFAFSLFMAGLVSAQTGRSVPDKNKKLLVVEASCGECQFKMNGKGCHLAIRMDGKSYFVDGSSIDEHGDAHADDGFCEKVRKAEVQGEVVNNRFQATYFKVLPVEKNKDKKKDKNKEKDKGNG